MDELIGLLAEAAALSRRASAESKGAVKQAVPQPQSRAPAPAAPVAPVAPDSHSAKALRQEAHPVGLTAAFHERSSLLTMVVAVEVLGPPPSLRPRERL